MCCVIGPGQRKQAIKTLCSILLGIGVPRIFQGLEPSLWVMVNQDHKDQRVHRGKLVLRVPLALPVQLDQTVQLGPQDLLERTSFLFLAQRAKPRLAHQFLTLFRL
jgi:hypothetical protein